MLYRKKYTYIQDSNRENGIDDINVAVFISDEINNNQLLLRKGKLNKLNYIIAIYVDCSFPFLSYIVDENRLQQFRFFIYV